MLAFHPTPGAAQAGPPAGTVWIDLLNATEAEVRLVEDHTGLTLPTPEDLSAIEQSSRLAFKDGVLRLSAPMLALADTDHPALSHVGLVLTAKLLVTVRFEHLNIFEAVAADACSAGAPTSAALVFTTLMEAFVGRQADLLEAARAKLDTVSHTVFRNPANDPIRMTKSGAVVRRKLQTIGRVGERISLIRESLLATGRAIPYALDMGEGWFKPDLVRRLTDARTDIDALNQFEEHLLGKVQFLLDAVIGFIGIEQNDIFKVLTIVSVVGIFPTLVAGIYGMNFHNMPEYTWAYGYQWGLGLIVATTIIPLLWFKWRGWM